MKKITSLFVCFVLVAFGAVTEAQEKQGEPATIVFEKTTHDFGKIKEGTLATYSFVFTNTGKTPLVLSSVQPSCGCTTPEWTKEPIAPGAKATIKAAYNSYGRPGAFQKYITVKSNGTPAELTLTIKGEVEVNKPEPVSPVRMQNMD